MPDRVVIHKSSGFDHAELDGFNEAADLQKIRFRDYLALTRSQIRFFRSVVIRHCGVGAAMTVLNELKPGLDEKLYENALVIELRARGRTAEQQRQFPVHYRGVLIGTLIPDLIVDEKVIVDPKVVTAFNDTHLAQMLGYLNITDLQVAILINFKESKLKWKRVVKEFQRTTTDYAHHADI